MKKTDLEKNKALKLVGKMKQTAMPDRFSNNGINLIVDKREQRKLDQAQGLISFPVKIKQTLVEEIRRRAAAENLSTNDIVGMLIEKALEQSPKA